MLFECGVYGNYLATCVSGNPEDIFVRPEVGRTKPIPIHFVEELLFFKKVKDWVVQFCDSEDVAAGNPR
ncbi:hypothetical protein PSDVSF_24450 [Pseudodesulfovibrio sediminis]|uniref:Uncharacterized protein n=1 Tax=Pseudodesulfovibrio sediminis TaxID=2810563 RepID=A0ABN6EWH4_9BACT|nr:hypothetical protein PSDVSF_24450 [Pseudodesulfovibrio sediminis]